MGIANKEAAAATKSKAGRPQKTLDHNAVKQLAAIQCTDEEIAAALSVSLNTIRRRKQSDPVFAELIEEGRAQGRASLRRIQWQMAKNGSAVMAIFLGKNILRQRDRFDDEQEGDPAKDQARRIKAALDAIDGAVVDSDKDAEDQ